MWMLFSTIVAYPQVKVKGRGVASINAPKPVHTAEIWKLYIYIYLSGFDKRYHHKFHVRFNNLTLEVFKKQLKVAS